MPQNPTLEEWRLLTLRLRIAGWSYREIATRVGVSPGTGLPRHPACVRPTAQGAIRDRGPVAHADSHGLEEKLTRWWTRADVDPAALDRVIKLLAERSKLFGLHAPPQQVELQDHKPPGITVRFVNAPGREEEDAHGA